MVLSSIYTNFSPLKIQIYSNLVSKLELSSLITRTLCPYSNFTQTKLSVREQFPSLYSNYDCYKKLFIVIFSPPRMDRLTHTGYFSFVCLNFYLTLSLQCCLCLCSISLPWSYMKINFPSYITKAKKYKSNLIPIITLAQPQNHTGQKNPTHT